MRYARLAEIGSTSVVVEIIDPPAPIGECYTAEFVATLLPAADGVCEGWVLEAGALVPPPPPEPLDLKVALLDYAAQRRWEAETGGILVAGQPIRTDRESQALINGAYTIAQDQPEQMFSFKTTLGFVTLSAAEITLIARQVGAHVQACFGVEANVAAMITAAPPTITTREEVDTAFAEALGG